MESKLGFVLKVLMLSAGLAFAIKYVAPQFPIPATATNALVIVLLPTFILAATLTWRMKPQDERQN